MGVPKVIFKVCETRKCPKYQYGDSFTVSGIAVVMDNEGDSSFVCSTVIQSNQNRDNCTVLYSDLVKTLIKYERADQIPDCMIACTGCTGSLHLEHLSKPLDEIDMKDEDSLRLNNAKIADVLHVLTTYPFFRNINPKQLTSILHTASIKKYKKNGIIIHKGDPGRDFYVIISGKVNVLNDAGIPIATLNEGEVFGEMSLICDEDIGATIQAKEDSEILNIDQINFKYMLDKYPVLHRYFTRLMAKRLSQSNKVRSEDYASGMMGKLEEIPPEALFQTLHVNAKTGILTINQLSGGTARFSMRQGALIKASYKGLHGDVAFFEILREKKGHFKFNPGLPPEDLDVPELGYFMKLLMEGMQRLDEAPDNAAEENKDN